MAAPCSRRTLLRVLFSVFLLLLSAPPSHSSATSMRQGWSFSADLSRSSPLPLNAYSSPSLTLFTPILPTSNFYSGKGFSLGFLSFLSPSNTLPTSIQLSLCLGTNKTDSSGRSYAIPVWTLNLGTPLKQVGATGKVSLSAESSRQGEGLDLVLRNGDGNDVWRKQGIVAMEVQDKGNWVLYDANNVATWQSYEHPTDTLLQGQTISLGMKIVSSNFLYVMEMKPGGLFLHMVSQAPAPLYYWGFPINAAQMVEYIAMHSLDLSTTPTVNITSTYLSYACQPGSPGFIEPYGTLAGPNVSVGAGCALSNWTAYNNTYANASYDPDLLRLTSIGLLEGLTYLFKSGEHVILISPRVKTDFCLPPATCGAYGLCNVYQFGSKHACRCLDATDNATLSNVFNPIDRSDPSRGCARATPLRGSDQTNSTMVEVKRGGFSPLHIMYETTYKTHTYPLDECTAHCISNCSCAGFFYHYASSFCLPFSDSTGLSNISIVSFESTLFSAFIKVQPGGFSSSGAAEARGSVPPRTKANNHSSRFNEHIIKPVVFTICAATVVLLIGAVFIAFRRYRPGHVRIRTGSAEMETDVGEEDLQTALPMLPTRHSYKELQGVTKGFNKLLGSGGFGCVYEGVLRDGRRVAVKKLDQVSPSMKQFLAEVSTIGGISHYNVVRLFGYCSQRSKRLLVYEFMDNGSLDRWLFCKSNEQLLSWSMRYSIALGTARGLAYLHGGCTQPIIHFDIKPQNILLDKNFVPKLSDFGLSKLVERETSFVMTGVRGTPGYLAPEWLSHSVVSKKCDVYSYGMVLLELVSGRRNAIQELAGSEECYFPTWAALKCQQGKMAELVDKQLEGNFDEEQVNVLMHVAFLCIRREPSGRPSMGDVCKMLDGLVPLKEEENLFVFDMEGSAPEREASWESCSILREGR